ncbi:hypothetical protein [Actinomadura macrotermitis]|uniref:Uncharacterized protein n=1 Tax=Actinomadura macrotermitis TaxID=2585200 RepID=A0A7K0BSY4_9ACTN|nr:hypothetical protein [Actinomadura macrotermitis]MQY04303.1 hypothetical protein [Actinomadura macrotermitis]
MPGRPDGWWISPAIPTIANGVLALLWGFSALGGWGDAAFCGESGLYDRACGDHFRIAVLASAPVAAVAALLAVAAWLVPSLRRRPDRLDSVLATAALIWVLAEGILFIGGYFVRA